MTSELMADYEAKAEAAYAALYDARTRGHDLKDLKDDALLYLARAAEVAEALGEEEAAAKFRARGESIIAVWDRQFRGRAFR